MYGRQRGQVFFFSFKQLISTYDKKFINLLAQKKDDLLLIFLVFVLLIASNASLRKQQLDDFTGTHLVKQDVSAKWSNTQWFPAYRGPLKAGCALPVSAVGGSHRALDGGKGLQLPQVHHGLHHHVQGAHARGPASPRTPGGVGCGLDFGCTVHQGYLL